MDKDQARYIASTSVLEAIEEMNLRSILNKFDEDERALLEDAFEHLRDEIRQFGQSADRSLDEDSLLVTEEEMARYEAIRRQQFANPEPVPDGDEEF